MDEMKIKIAAAILSALCLLKVQAQAFLFPTNPAPLIKLAWTPSPSAGITSYNLYIGIGSRQYTNAFSLGNVTNVTLSVPARGVRFYYTVTALAGLMESDFSNEVSYQAANAPTPPGGLLPPVTLVVQYKNDLQDFMWADSDMSWSVDPNQATNQFFRLSIVSDPVTAGPEVQSKQPPLPPGLIR